MPIRSLADITMEPACALAWLARHRRLTAQDFTLEIDTTSKPWGLLRSHLRADLRLAMVGTFRAHGHMAAGPPQ